MKTNKINSKEACTLAHKIRRETGCSLAEAFKQAYSGTPSRTPNYYTKEDLNRIFSDKAKELMNKGYMIHTPTMAGSQGEMAYITFIKNNTLYRLSMFDTYTVGHYSYDGYVTIQFGEALDSEEILNGRTFWKDAISTVFWSIVVAKASTWRKENRKQQERYIPTERIEACEAKAEARFKAQGISSWIELSDKSYKAALAWIKTVKGYKGTKLVNVQKVFKHRENGSYSIYFTNNHGKTVCLNTETAK